MEIRYKDKKIRDICENEKKAIKRYNHKPPLQVVVCTMPKRHYYKLEAKALQFGLPFAYNPIQLLK